MQLDAVLDRVEARVEVDVTASQAGEHAQAGHIDELAREQEQVDYYARFHCFLCNFTIEGVWWMPGSQG